jgi:hypothetical protein
MPNNLVFNNVASQMQTQIFGQNGSNILAVQTDTSGNLRIVGTVTAVITSGTVTALLDTVTAVVSSGTITALLGTVTAVVTSGTVTALLDTVTAVVSSGTITALLGTVTAVVTSGTITALLDTVTAVVTSGTVTALLGTVTAVVAFGTVTALSVAAFAETATTVVVSANSTITALTSNTSLQKVYSFYVANTSGADTLTAILQISPVNTETFYLTEPTGVTAIAPSSKSVLVAQKYLKFTRLLLQAGGTAITAEVSYNAQT